MRYANWQVGLEPETANSLIKELALRHCRLGGRLCDDLAALIKRDDYASIVSYSVDYSNCVSRSDVEPYRHLRQALALYTKRPDLPLGVDRECVAYEKFIGSEIACANTNALFRLFESRNVSFTPSVTRSLFRAQRKIQAILGRAPTIESLRLAFGPGATTRTKRSESNPCTKMGHGLICSTDLLASGLLPSLLREVPHWTAALPRETARYSIDDDGWLVEHVEVQVDPGHLQFVPKNATTDRSIMVEPSLNTLLQHGIGRYMASRLRKVGVDIRNQEPNRRLAREGSLWEHFELRELYGARGLATLDLSSASDTVSTNLVKFLLPDDWFFLLSSARTSECVYRGEYRQLEKFSSMGNGFTFPLETLIFWSLAWGCGATTLSVYGDDIIVDSDHAEQVVHLLGVCGFSVNSDKSFITGPFRESCGGDYLLGTDIRPFYLKKEMSMQQLFLLHNFYARNYDDEGAQIVLRLIPPDWRLFGPDGYGDGHLVDLMWTRADPSARVHRVGPGGRRYTFKTLSLKPKSVRTRFPGDWVSPLYSIYVREGQSVDPRMSPQSPVEMTEDGFPRWPVPGASFVCLVDVSI